jgi:hypothetical protein
VHRPNIVEHHDKRQLLGFTKLLYREAFHLYCPNFPRHLAAKVIHSVEKKKLFGRDIQILPTLSAAYARVCPLTT